MKQKPEIDLWAEERRLWQTGCGTICGADEAGDFNEARRAARWIYDNWKLS